MVFLHFRSKNTFKSTRLSKSFIWIWWFDHADETVLTPLLSTASLQAQPGPSLGSITAHSVSHSHNYFMLMQFFSALYLPFYFVSTSFTLSLPISSHYCFAGPNTAAFNLKFPLFLTDKVFCKLQGIQVPPASSF